MNREILFRGKRIDNKQWVYGGISIFENEATIFDINCVVNSAYQVNIDTVSQFTGIIIDNVKVFEGDIVKRTLQFNLVVEWSLKYAEWMFVDPNDCNWDKSFNKNKIIGNKFDNPELIDVRYW